MVKRAVKRHDKAVLLEISMVIVTDPQLSWLAAKSGLPVPAGRRSTSLNQPEAASSSGGQIPSFLPSSAFEQERFPLLSLSLFRTSLHASFQPDLSFPEHY